MYRVHGPDFKKMQTFVLENFHVWKISGVGTPKWKFFYAKSKHQIEDLLSSSNSFKNKINK